MHKLKPEIFLVPVIALVLIIWMFNYLLSKADKKEFFKQIVYKILILAFLLNFAWEVIQIPLFKNAGSSKHIVFCAVASVADTIMVLLIYFGFALIYKNPVWVTQITIPRILLLMLTGGIGAVAAEIRNLSAGSWAYSKSMPIIPFLNVGLSPVLQFMLLPAIIFYLGFKIKKEL